MMSGVLGDVMPHNLLKLTKVSKERCKNNNNQLLALVSICYRDKI